ncbi:MAG: hypothetical protein Q4E88_02920 [Coriobacteriia bacterium]|nr:hypothetical protein [Coriobacteriia bacterium]
MVRTLTHSEIEELEQDRLREYEEDARRDACIEQYEEIRWNALKYKDDFCHDCEKKEVCQAYAENELPEECEEELVAWYEDEFGGDQR